jgi:secreted Zn-dependent insulinase-like peptidase
MQKIFFIVGFFLFTTTLFAKSIIVPKNDNRKYKSIYLKNGIQAILISDENAQDAAAAIDIGVGSFENPLHMEGLAHFLEHMLFLGNEKYPQTNEFSNFLSKHGGFNNAYTSGKNTNYHFEVHHQHLEEAFDRLVEFFITPTFDKEYIQKEIQAVHSEHQKNLLSEPRRGLAVLKELSNPDHPFSQFHTGNLETLSNIPDVENQVKLFYKKYYIPQLMKVAILGRESLEELEELVKAKLGKIPAKKTKLSTPLKRYEKKLYQKHKTPAFIQIQSLKNIRKLNFLFEIDSTKKDFRQKAIYYISSLIGDEQKGSILSYLKERKWATELSAGLAYEQIETDIFGINITLTPEGEKNIQQITKVIFDYLDLLKKEGVEKWRFEEMKQIANFNFHKQDLLPAPVLVRFLSSNAHYFEAENLLNANWEFGKFSKPAISKVLDQINVDNLKIIYTTKHPILLAKKEKWYGTAYKAQNISPKDEFYWKKSEQKNEALALPPKNSYLFSTEPTMVPDTQKAIFTKLPIANADVYHIKNTSFQVPKIRIYMDILTPNSYKTPANSTFTRIYSSLIREKLAEKLYPAYLLGYQFSINPDVRGLRLVLEGYPEKMDFFVRQVLGAFSGSNFSKSHYELIKQETKENWENLPLSPAYRIANYQYQQLVREPFWHYEDYLNIFDDISYQKFQNFQKDLFRFVALEFFIYGNIEKKDAVALTKNIVGSLKFEKIKNKPAENIIELPASANYFIQTKVQDTNSAILSSYQASDRMLTTEVKMRLLGNFIAPKFYDSIRTNQQLGYLVWSYYTGRTGSNALNFVIQSAVAPPLVLQNEINKFFVDFEKELVSLSDEDFVKVKRGLEQILKQNPENFDADSNYYYQSIQQQDFQLTKKKDLQEGLKQIRKKDLHRLYQELFLKEKSKSIAVHILSADSKKEKNIANSEEITDREVFKADQKYIPIP